MNTGEVTRSASDVVGVCVHNSATSEKLGEVTDALVHPTEGRLLGFSFRTALGDEQFLSADDCELKDSLLLAPAVRDSPRTRKQLAGGIGAARSLKGVSVVTDAGDLVGRVEEIRINRDCRKVEFEIARDGWRGLFGDALILAGDTPHAYSPEGRRLIVPAAKCASDKFAQPQGDERLRLRRTLERYGLPLWAAATISLLGVMIWL